MSVRVQCIAYRRLHEARWTHYSIRDHDEVHRLRNRLHYITVRRDTQLNTAFVQSYGRSRDVPEYSCTGGTSSYLVSGVPLLQVSGASCKN